jgi:hypothetical protein
VSASKLQRVRSLGSLRTLARTDPKYAALAKLASANLGGPSEPLDAALRWLDTNANEVGEAGVVDEVNYVRDLVGGLQ